MLIELDQVVPLLPLVDEVSVFDYWGVRERFGIVAIDRHRMYWAAAWPETGPGEVTESDPATMLERRFAAWPAPVADVIRATPSDTITKIHVHDLDPVDVWHRDNVLLIGDAAHAPLPTSGQGACQALEDAWHLARCLDEHAARNDSNLDATLASFTLRRRSKTTAITERARDFAHLLFGENVNESARQQIDPVAEIEALTNAWGAHLPMAQAR